MGNSVVHPPAFNGRWTTGLCGCFEDCESCCCGCWCPCIVVGRTIEVIDRGTTSCCTGGSVFCCLEYCTGCGCFYTFGYRSRLRQKFDLPAEPCADLCVDCCCLGCSICQVYREMKFRGIDPVLGWHRVKAIYDNPGQPPQPLYQEIQLQPGPPVFDQPPQAPAKQVPDQQFMATVPPAPAPAYTPPGQQYMGQQPPPPPAF